MPTLRTVPFATQPYTVSNIKGKYSCVKLDYVLFPLESSDILLVSHVDNNKLVKGKILFSETTIYDIKGNSSEDWTIVHRGDVDYKISFKDLRLSIKARDGMLKPLVTKPSIVKVEKEVVSKPETINKMEPDRRDVQVLKSICLYIIYLAIIFCIGINAVQASQCEFTQQLSPYQKQVASQVYKAASPYDLGYTAVAMAYHESKLGLYKVRYNGSDIKDTSVGIFHTVVYWKTKGLSPFESGLWTQKMLESDAYSIQIGVQDILYWQGRANGNWSRGVGMYNGGNKPNIQYARTITKIVKNIKHCDFI